LENLFISHFADVEKRAGRKQKYFFTIKIPKKIKCNIGKELTLNALVST